MFKPETYDSPLDRLDVACGRYKRDEADFRGCKVHAGEGSGNLGPCIFCRYNPSPQKEFIQEALRLSVGHREQIVAVECPACGHSLTIIFTANRTRSWGGCESEGCLKWIE